MRRSTSVWRAALLAAAIMPLLAGCRIDVAAETVLADDGTGTAGWTLTADPVAVSAMDNLDIAQFGDLEQFVEAPWQHSRLEQPDGSVQWRLWRPVADLDDASHAFAELVASLAPDDPAIHVALRPTQTLRTMTVEGDAWFALPRGVGLAINGVSWGPDSEMLQRLIVDTVDASVRIAVADDVVAHNADYLSDGTLVWHLEADTVRAVSFTTDRPLPVALIATGATATALVLGAFGYLLGGLRGRRG